MAMLMFIWPNNSKLWHKDTIPTIQEGMIQFLEDYEDAFMNMEYVMWRKSHHDSNTSKSLYTDDGKRRLFIQNFTVPDLTAELIESVENNTQTWEALVDQLFCRLSRRTIHAKDIAYIKAHQSIMEPPMDIKSSICHMKLFLTMLLAI